MTLHEITKGYLNLSEKEQELFMKRIDFIQNIYSLHFEKGTPYFNIDYILEKYLNTEEENKDN